MPICERCSTSVPSSELQIVHIEGRPQVICALCRRDAFAGEPEVASIILHKCTGTDGRDDYRVRINVNTSDLTFAWSFTFGEVARLFRGDDQSKLLEEKNK